MARAFLRGVLVAGLLACAPRLSIAQFMYLDSNGDGLSNAADRLNSTGTPTSVDVYVITSQNRDGSVTACDTGDGDLTINQYAFNLAATGGSVSFSGFVNRQPGMTVSFGELNAGNNLYKNGAGGGTVNPPGLYRLATLTITVISGMPSVVFDDLVAGSADFTSFGTGCSGVNSDNNYTLGLDWFDTGGLDPPMSDNAPPSISAPDSVLADEGSPISFAVSGSDPDSGQTVTISADGVPAFLSISGGGPSPSVGTATAAGTPSFSDAGTYWIGWTVSDDGVPAETGNATTVLIVQNTDQAPVVTAPAAAAGNASTPIEFTVAAQDPDGEAVQSIWTTGVPPGATLTPSANPSEANFEWVPNPDVSGTFSVDFVAGNSSGAGQATTEITVGPPHERRPWVSPELRTLRAGTRRFERLCTVANDGRVHVDFYLKGSLSSEALAAMGVDVGTRVGGTMTARCPLNVLNTLFEREDIDAVVAPSVCYPLLDSSAISVNVAGLRTLPPTLPLVGQVGGNVIVGIVDTGIDVGHGDFDGANGTRIVRYWNQYPTVTGSTPYSHKPSVYPAGAGFNQGEEWDSNDIDFGDVNARGDDSLGHGTYVAGIAAGNGSAGGPSCGRPVPGNYQYVGVAPGANLCVVKLPAAQATKIWRLGILEPLIVKGVDYVFRTATDMGMPAVVNLSLASHSGPHDGTSYLDYHINGLTGPGKIVVAGAGNDANSGQHASLPIHTGATQGMTLAIDEYVGDHLDSGDFVDVHGWYRKWDNADATGRHDSIGVRVIPPGPAGADTSWAVPPLSEPPVTEGSVAAFRTTPYGYVTVEMGSSSIGPPPDPLRATWEPDVPIRIQIQDYANLQGTFDVAPGTWTIEITSLLAERGGDTDMYITEADLGPQMKGISFVAGADPRRTVASPASADSVIAVGAYVSRVCWPRPDRPPLCNSTFGPIGGIAPFSSRGPRREDVSGIAMIKPDITAPGGPVISSRSRVIPPTEPSDTTIWVGPGPYVVGSGTSASSPQVAGAVALLLAQGDSSWSTAPPARIKARIRSAARADEFTGITPSNTWGAGKLDIRAALAPAMGIRFTEPKRRTVFTTHWGQASVMADSSTPGNALDSVVVELALDGCNYTLRVATLPSIGFQSVGLAHKSYGFLYEAPESSTTTARLRATGYKGPNKVQALSDSLFTFDLGPRPTGVGEQIVPRRFALFPNAPNPFNPVTVIRFEIARPGHVSLRVFSLDGRLVRTLVGQPLPPGSYSVLWEGDNDRAERVASGIYFCQITSGGERLKRKMSLIK